MTNIGPNDIVLGKIVQRDPEIHSGDLVFAGTRVPVDSLVGYLKGAHSIEEFLQDYPTVEYRGWKGLKLCLAPEKFSVSSLLLLEIYKTNEELSAT